MDAPTDERFWLVARDKPGLLVAIIRELAGKAWISFEGDLSRCRLAQISGATAVETAILKRNTLSPFQDFIVAPLEPETIRPILDEVLPDAKVVHDILHVQIEKEGKLAFGAYDNFHPDCIVCWPVVPIALLNHLVEIGVLKSYLAVPCSAESEGSQKAPAIMPFF